MVRPLAAATLVAVAGWIAFTLGGARLFAWRIGHAVGVPVTVERLGLDLAPPAFVLHDVRAGTLRASLVRMAPPAVVALLRRVPAVRDVRMEHVRVPVADERGATRVFRASVVEVDSVVADARPTVRLTGRIVDRRGVIAVRYRRRDRRVHLAALLRAVDERTLAPFIAAPMVRRARIDGRLRARDAVIEGDLRAREVAIRRAAVDVRIGRLDVDGLVLDLEHRAAAAGRAVVTGLTVRRAGLPPLRGVTAVALGLDTARASDRILARATLGGGVLRVRGTVDPSRAGFDAEVKLGGARVAQLIPGDAAPDLRVTDGRLSGRFRLAGPPWAATRVALALDALRVVEASARDGEPVLACDRAVADADRIDTTPLRARLRHAALGGVTLRVRRERDGLWPANRLAALGAWPAVQASLATPGSGSGPSELPALDVSWERGTFVFEDRVLDPAARLAVHDLVGALHREAGGSPRRMTGAVHGTLEGASFAADLGVEGSRWRVSLDTKPLDASTLNPWLTTALDLTVTGTLAAKSEVDLRGRDFAAFGRVSAESLVMTDQGHAPQLLGLSVPRAFMLAADHEGRIVLTLAASGAVADAGEAFARALADALAPAIIAPVAGVVTEPLVLPFRNGSDSVDDAAGEPVDRLAVFLHHRPALIVSLRGRSAPDDVPADPVTVARGRAEHVRERLCRDRGIPEERVRLGPSASGGPPATIVEIASSGEIAATGRP